MAFGQAEQGGSEHVWFGVVHVCKEM